MRGRKCGRRTDKIVADLFNIELETDLSEFDSTVTDGGDLSQSGAAALASTSGGMSCLIDDTTKIYGQKNQSAPASNEIRLRMYIDPNGLTMASEDSFVVMQMGLSVSPWLLLRLYLRYYGTQYQIRCTAYGDGGYAHQAEEAISDAEHYVEVHVVRATTNSSADGETQWWVDGVAQEHWSDIDNYDIFALLSKILIGAADSLDAGTSGTFYLDEIKANDDGGEIGAVVAGGVATQMVYYRRRRV